MTHRGVKLQEKPMRLDARGQFIPPPYRLDRWCGHCGMPLVDREFHPVEACVVFKRTRWYDQALIATRKVLDESIV
jgi:hypothetical protein